MTLDELVRQYGPIVGIIISVFGAGFPLGILFANSRVKVTEARAAKEKAEATAIEALSKVTTSFVQLQHTALERNNVTLETLITALTELALTTKLAADKASASGAVIATHMETANVAQAAAVLASTAMDASQAAILADIRTLITNLSLLTAAIEKQDIVDDGLRADMLSRISRLEEFLKRKEEKEKQNETLEPQTSVALTGSVRIEPNPESLSGGTG